MSILAVITSSQEISLVVPWTRLRLAVENPASALNAANFFDNVGSHHGRSAVVGRVLGSFETPGRFHRPLACVLRNSGVPNVGWLQGTFAATFRQPTYEQLPANRISDIN